MNTLSSLKPYLVWKHFEDICAIPHPSKHEEQIVAHLIDFAKKYNLEFCQDSIGNVLIKKNATSGYENREIVALQAHVDMVPQKNSETIHNFELDAIKPIIVDDRVKAQHTTLGADNGIGMAAMLAILESNDLEHGAIEALFTRDEETGMTGAIHLDKNLLKAKYLINTDTENANEITVGCAGGIDANFTFPISYNTNTETRISYSFTISGLTGGHSGFEINLGRANANILLSQFLWLSTQKYGAVIHSLQGGNMRNAIPREAYTQFSIPTINSKDFLEFTQSYISQTTTIYSKSDPQISCELLEILAIEKFIEPQYSERILQAIISCPNGVISYDNGSVVKTSTNLSIISTINNTIEINCLLRSFEQEEKMKLAETMKQIFELYGAQSNFKGDYPGWTPIWNSPLIQIVSQASKQVYGTSPKIEVVHAGLECGIFSGIYPHIEYVSFGPTIRNPHSPDEYVDIASVQTFWDVLCVTLKNIPIK